MSILFCHPSVCNEYSKTGFYTINKNGICYPTKLCDCKSFREYKNRLKAVGRNTEDEYKNNIKNSNVIYKAYKNAGADGANKTDVLTNNQSFASQSIQQLFKVL